MVQEKIHEAEEHFKKTFKHVEDLAKRHNVSPSYTNEHSYTNDPRHGKTNILHRRKQKRRSASQ